MKQIIFGFYVGTYGGDDGDTVEQSSRQAPLAWLLDHVPSLRLFPIITV